MTGSLIAAAALASCGQATAPAEEKAAAPAAAEAPATAAATPPAAVEPGSGTYAANCETNDQSYAIELTKDAANMVVGKVTQADKTFSNLLTSYSYMGQDTPSNFLVAIMFDEGNAPAGVTSPEGRIEIWKGEAAYYALVDGEKSKRLDFCAS